MTNYGAGNLAVFPVKADGDLALTPVFQKQYPTDAGSGVFRQRQNQSHPHGSFFYKNGKFVYVTDLGLDKIHRFRREEDGLYTELTSVEMKPGEREKRFSKIYLKTFCVREKNVFTKFILSG